jgi:hypothetical protein
MATMLCAGVAKVLCAGMATGVCDGMANVLCDGMATVLCAGMASGLCAGMATGPIPDRDRTYFASAKSPARLWSPSSPFPGWCQAFLSEDKAAAACS